MILGNSVYLPDFDFLLDITSSPVVTTDFLIYPKIKIQSTSYDSDIFLRVLTLHTHSNKSLIKYHCIEGPFLTSLVTISYHSLLFWISHLRASFLADQTSMWLAVLAGLSQLEWNVYVVRYSVLYTAIS